MKPIIVALLLLLVGWFTCARVWAYSSPGTPTGYVNDFAGILSANTKQQLEARLSTLDASTSAQLTVVTIKSLEGDTIENYANKLFAEWGIGQKGKDNGILLLIALNERQMRIETGYGLEGALTDAESSYIIRNIISPAFKSGQYDQGVTDGVEAILTAAAEDLVPSSTTQVHSSFSAESTWQVVVLFFVFIQFIGAILARSKSWWLGGIIGGIIGLIVTLIAGFILTGLVTMVVLIPLGLLFDYVVSKQYQKSKTTGSYPWWIGGRSGIGGGGSSGGGFGGFGGGRSGGGGSSGGW